MNLKRVIRFFKIKIIMIKLTIALITLASMTSSLSMVVEKSVQTSLDYKIRATYEYATVRLNNETLTMPSTSFFNMRKGFADKLAMSVFGVCGDWIFRAKELGTKVDQDTFLSKEFLSADTCNVATTPAEEVEVNRLMRNTLNHRDTKMQMIRASYNGSDWVVMHTRNSVDNNKMWIVGRNKSN